MNDNLQLASFDAGDLTFDQWRAQVDAECVRLTGSTAKRFNDWHFADAYGALVEPVAAARASLAADVTGRGFLQLAGIDPNGVL